MFAALDRVRPCAPVRPPQRHIAPSARLGRYGEAAGYPARPGGFAVNTLTSAFTQFVPSRDARVYACGVGPREDRSGVISPTAPTTWPVWGATAKPPVFTHLPGGFADVEGGGVMVRANWSRIASRNRMRRQGGEDRKDNTPAASEPPKQPRRKLSKAELREQAAAAFLAWRAGQTSTTSSRWRIV